MPRLRYTVKQHRRALGNVLRSLRKQARLSQQDVAIAANMDRSYLCEIEAGKHDPGSYKIAALAAIYGSTFAEVATRVEACAVKRPKR